MQEQPKKTGPVPRGARSVAAGGGKPYTPDQREQYRAYYQNRQKQRAVGAATAEARRPAAGGSPNTGARRPAAGGSPNTGARRPVAGGSPNTGARRPATGGSPNMGARRPAAGDALSAAGSFVTGAFQRAARGIGAGPTRPAARRASSGGSGGGSFAASSTVRMLAVAALAVLLMFGLVKLIGSARRGAETDYVPPMRTEDYLAMLAASAQPGETRTPSDPGQTPSAPDGTDAPPDSAQTLEPDATEPPPPTAGPQPEEGFFPGEDDSGAPLPTQQPASTGGARTARLRFAGDVVVDKEMLTTAYNSKTGKYSFKNFFGLARDFLSNADLTAINVDGSMGGEKYYKYGYSGYPQFNTPPTLMYALQSAGVDMLTLANNHCLDGWWEGFKMQIKNADYVGLMHIGGFRTQEEFNTPEIFDINGIKVGFLNYTQSFNSMDSRGVDKAALTYGVRSTRGADYAGDVKKVRAAGAEVVVVVMHWGKEYLTSPDDNQKAMAKEIAAAGADVIVGGHPHVAQVGGWLSVATASGGTNDCLIIYSLGNFLTEHRNVAGALRTDWGVVFEFTLQENPQTGKIDVVAPKYLPVGVWRIGSPGAYDWRVVSVDATLANRPAGMSDAAYQRFLEISAEADSTYAKSGFERIAY